jgi:hypothetical protein
MRRKITREHAEKIVRKLKAEIVTSRAAHDLAQVFYKGVLITEFGIRRGSSKDLGHPFLPGDLQLTQHQTLDLANCPLSYDQWVEIMKDKGLIVEEASAN